MNSVIENNLFYIIVFLLIIIFALIGTIVFVLVKLLNQKNTSPPETVQSSATAQSKKTEIITEKFYCQNHADIPSTGSCLICEEVFCDNCLIEHEGMYFCKEHFKIFVGSKWKQITDVKTTPDSPEDGLFVWEFKREIWKAKRTPSFILTHYKINIDQDYIESYVQLNIREDEEARLKVELENFKARH